MCALCKLRKIGHAHRHRTLKEARDAMRRSGWTATVAPAQHPLPEMPQLAFNLPLRVSATMLAGIGVQAA